MKIQGLKDIKRYLVSLAVQDSDRFGADGVSKVIAVREGIVALWLVGLTIGGIGGFFLSAGFMRS